MERSGDSSSTLNDGEGNDNNDSGHIAGVLLWEDGGLHAFKFCRFRVYWRGIKVGLRRGKFDYAATASSSNRRPEMSGGNKKEGETYVVTVVPTWPNFPLAFLNPMYQYPPQH